MGRRSSAKNGCRGLGLTPSTSSCFFRTLPTLSWDGITNQVSYIRARRFAVHMDAAIRSWLRESITPFDLSLSQTDGFITVNSGKPTRLGHSKVAYQIALRWDASPDIPRGTRRAWPTRVDPPFNRITPMWSLLRRHATLTGLQGPEILRPEHFIYPFSGLKQT